MRKRRSEKHDSHIDRENGQKASKCAELKARSKKVAGRKKKISIREKLKDV
jgi:hypothetical protein